MDAPSPETPDIDLADIERDLARVEQALVDLESGDPEAAVAWLSDPEPAAP